MKTIYEILVEQGCIKQGHFLLKSGKHSGTYCDMKFLSLNPKAMSEVCKILSNSIANEFNLEEIDVVVGPAVGAIIPAYQVALHLDKQNNFAEKGEACLYFRNDSNIIGKNVLIVEDVATTGGTIQQTIDAVTLCGGNVVVVAVMVDRSGGKADFGLPLVSGIELNFPLYEADNCDICNEGEIPLYKPGSKN